MALSVTQRATLAAHIRANTDPAVVAAVAIRNDTEITRIYNGASAFIVWRTSVPEQDFTDLVSAEATTWSWPAFIARSVGEQNGWARLFQRGSVDASKANVRQAFLDIFSGAQNNAPAQRTHCAAIAKRAATIAESVFATGTGTTGTPGILGWEGTLAVVDDVSRAMNENP